MKSNGQHQKQAIRTDQRLNNLDEHVAEEDKQKLHADDARAKNQALEKIPKDKSNK